MSNPQESPDSQPAAETKAGASGEGADASNSAGGTNIVLYTPKIEAEAASEPRAPRVTSKWATRRVSRIVAIAAIAAAVGAISGSLATLGISHVLQANTAAVASISNEANTLRQTIARLETEFGALKTNTERATKTAAGQLSQTTDRVEKIARTQDEAAAKLARIADTQEKIRAAAASAPAVAAAAPVATAGDVTGSIAATPPKSEARIPPAPPILDNWVLAKVSRGGAIVAGRTGFYEVYPGDPLPGAGRVEAVRYQDGRWVVVTQKGLIIRR